MMNLIQHFYSTREVIGEDDLIQELLLGALAADYSKYAIFTISRDEAVRLISRLKDQIKKLPVEYQKAITESNQTKITFFGVKIIALHNVDHCSGMSLTHAYLQDARNWTDKELERIIPALPNSGSNMKRFS